MDPVLARRDGAVLVLTLNRPDSLNALTLDDARLLGERLDAAAADPSVRAVVLTGAGSAFSAGGDTKLLLEIPAMSDDEVRHVVYATFQRPVRGDAHLDRRGSGLRDLELLHDRQVAEDARARGREAPLPAPVYRRSPIRYRP